MAVFSDAEKIDVLIKSSFGVTSTDETLPWYNEVAEPFNEYTIGENILIDTIPSNPVFDTSRNPSDIGLSSSDFHSSNNDNDLATCSIVDDSTGTVRRFRYLLLDTTSGTNNAGRSWTKKNSNGDNILHNSLAFNYKKVGAYAPYESKLYRTNGTSPIQIGPSTGSWSYNTGTGILFFADYEEQSHVSTSNPPAFIVYVYIGQAGLSNFTAESSFDNNADLSLNANLAVGGDVSFNGDLTINGNLEVFQQQNTSVINTTVNNYEVIVTNDLSLNGKIAVEGDASFNRVDICGNFYAQYPDDSIPSSAIIGGTGGGGSGNLSTGVGGILTISGDIVGQEDLELNGGIIIQDDYLFDTSATRLFPDARFEKLEVRQDLSVYGDLSVNAFSVGKIMNFSGDIEIDTLNTTNIIQFDRNGTPLDVDLSGDVYRNSITTFGDIDAGGKIIADGDINANGKIIAVGDIIASGKINANGDISANGNLSVLGTLEFDNLSVIGINASGNVGIGTNNPGQNLHVHNNSGTAYIQLTAGTTMGTTQYNGLELATTTGGDAFIIQNEDANLRVNVNGAEAMRIDSDGNVGIGTTSPSYPLQIVGSATSPSVLGWHFSDGGTEGIDHGTKSYATSLYCNNSIGTQGWIFTGSDRRIKQNIVEINDNSSLQKIRLLKPSTYTYKDPSKKGDFDSVDGFIAQEVKEVMPHATDTITECIPNIMLSGTSVSDVSNNYIITLSTFDTASLELDSSGDIFPKLKTYIDDGNGKGKELFVTIKEIVSTTQIRVESEETLPSDLYVYGQEVDNFHILIKDKIFTTGISALQEIDRQQQADKAKIATLESQLADVLTRLAALEST